GSGIFSNSGQALGNSDSDSVALGDLDGDGDLDAMVANYDQPNTTWVNVTSPPTICLDGDCTYQDLQAAIDTAGSGSVITLFSGTLPITTTLDTRGKALTIRGAVDATTGEPLTVLDGQGLVGVLQCIGGEGPDTVFEDLVIRGGRAVDGGGLYTDASSPTVRRCRFESNQADSAGGGSYNRSGSPTFTDCTFQDNVAAFGGGMYNQQGSSPTVTGCVFTGNTATTAAGGMENFNQSNPVVTGCTFTGNAAPFGGGLRCIEQCDPVLTDCTFSSNTAESAGGGIEIATGSNPTLVNCTFTSNDSPFGGGLRCTGDCDPMLTDCVFTSNAAGADGGGIILADGSGATLDGCTFTGNT
ncbi:MAG: right-handed parallel beta-helix repeat-containing protein, partial [Planctomycetota bacterium]|nr:right-handed parallel beta-helix repeat-containing protein [Planctomycetota bacterium]